MRKPIKRASDKGKFKKELDSLFRKYILAIRPHKCQWCGSENKPLQVAHILPKGTYTKLRYLEENILLLCFPCHPPRWHLNPLEAAQLVERILGKQCREYLLMANKVQPTHTMFHLNNLKIAFKKRLEEM